MSLMSLRMSKFKAIAPVGASWQMGEVLLLHGFYCLFPHNYKPVVYLSQVHIPNGTSIGSATFVKLTVVSNGQTH